MHVTQAPVTSMGRAAHVTQAQMTSMGIGKECRPDTDDIYGERNECHPGTLLTILTTSVPPHLTPALPDDLVHSLET